LSSPQRSEQATESTAPTELLKLTPAELEEAAAAVEDLYRWNEVPTPPLVGKLRRLAQGAAEDAEPAAARDDAAELRAAVRRMAAADAELTVVGEAPRPDVDEWGAKWDAAQREYNAAMLNICQLAATEGES
jgi:hypothetical protein